MPLTFSFVALGALFAGLLVGGLPVVSYYLHALFGLGGPAFALFMSRARFAFVAAGLALVLASSVGLVLVVGAALLVVAGALVLEWRSIATRFVPDEEAKPSPGPVDPQAPVLVVSPGKALPARAYLLDWVAARHVVIDRAHGLVVTHCPLARSANVFRLEPGRQLRASLPWAGHYLLSSWTGPAWSQVTGEVVVGQGKSLELVPFRLTTWAEAQRAGAVELVAGDGRAFLPRAADQSCVVAPAGMPVDEPLSVVVGVEPSVAIEWSRVTSSPEGARVETASGPVVVRRDPVDGAVVAEKQGGQAGIVPSIPVRASVVARLVASGKSTLRRA